MSLPLYLLLFVYLIFLVIFVIFFMIILYHIFEAQTFNNITFFFTFMIFVLAAITIFFTWNLLSGINWQQQIEIFNQNNL